MIDEVRDLLDRYVAWLRDKTVLRQVNDWVEITTPYLDRHNDYLQIYAKRRDGGYLLTDDGYVMEDLARSGCSLESPKRQALLKMTLNGFGIQQDEGSRHGSRGHARPIRRGVQVVSRGPMARRGSQSANLRRPITRQGAQAG